MTRFSPYVIAALVLTVSACTNPYDPVQRGLGGGILGAASGAAIGVAAGGGPGAALGAAIGGATGVHLHPHRAPISATQPTDIPLTDIPAMRSRAMDIRATRDTPLIPVLQAMDTQAIRGSPVIPPTLVLQAMDTRNARPTLRIPTPVTDTPWLAIPRRCGLLGPSTPSSLLAEFRPKIHSPPLVSGEDECLRKIALPAEKRATPDRSSGRGLEPLSASCVRHRFIHLGGKPEQA
jgi:hypothetical protein